MTIALEFHPLFEFDVQEHGNWLEARAPGLGDEFVAEVNRALDQLAERPESHRRCFGEYRRVLIRRFHMSVPFRILKGRVRVLGVVHGARDIPSWLKRRAGAP